MFAVTNQKNFCKESSRRKTYTISGFWHPSRLRHWKKCWLKNYDEKTNIASFLLSYYIKLLLLSFILDTYMRSCYVSHMDKNFFVFWQPIFYNGKWDIFYLKYLINWIKLRKFSKITIAKEHSSYLLGGFYFKLLSVLVNTWNNSITIIVDDVSCRLFPTDLCF